MGICSCQSDKKTKELIKLEKENETPEGETTEIPEKEKQILEAAKLLIKNAKDKTIDSVKNTMNQLSPVKTRTVARMKQLVKGSKWKREKQVILGNVEWKDTPPRELIGNLNMTIHGGVGKIRYVRYLKDPDTKQVLKEATDDGAEIGGNIISHYVEETIEPGQQISREALPIKGCPSAEKAKERMENARKLERNRVKKARGLE